jgi:hypothetical protein
MKRSCTCSTCATAPVELDLDLIRGRVQMTKVKLTPYDMEIITRALLYMHAARSIQITSSEDTLEHILSLAGKFANAEQVELEL